jgi:hypothetical protein
MYLSSKVNFGKAMMTPKNLNESEFYENINHFLSPRSTDIQRGGTICYGSGRVSLTVITQQKEILCWLTLNGK